QTRHQPRKKRERGKSGGSKAKRPRARATASLEESRLEIEGAAGGRSSTTVVSGGYHPRWWGLRVDAAVGREFRRRRAQRWDRRTGEVDPSRFGGGGVSCVAAAVWWSAGGGVDFFPGSHGASIQRWEWTMVASYNN
ncbi:unnamed protein product, partial [Urochloa humidicola]